MDYYAYLNSFINFELSLHQTSNREFNLKRVDQLLAAVGNPQKNLRIIHVAGTKGKGSVCAYISYILKAAGFRVGLYTSPHLHVLNERIRLLVPDRGDDKKDFYGQISHRELEKLIMELQPKIDPLRNDKALGALTFFEVLTVAALYYFAKKKTDFVILETGLGGRLDATNAVESMVDVITTIGFDHMHLLGHTLAKIAGEKAAIIKNRHSSVVVSVQQRQAMRVLSKRCREFFIAPVCVGRDVTWRLIKQNTDGQRFEIITRNNVYRNLRTHLLGDHQLMNAATAVGAVEALASLGITVKSKVIKTGIAQMKWPGRFEVVYRKPKVIIDCAHNGDSVKVLVETFRQWFPAKKAVVILGLSQDKDVQGFCRGIQTIADRIILTRANHPRAFDFSQFNDKSLFRFIPVDYIADVSDALDKALSYSTKNSIILITGSVFIAAQVREAVNHVSMEKSR